MLHIITTKELQQDVNKERKHILIELNREKINKFEQNKNVLHKTHKNRV